METDTKELTREQLLPQGFSLGLAIMDFFPVFFFSIAMVLVGDWLHSACFTIGAVMSVLAGMGKVAWKLILVIKKINITIFNRLFFPLMLGGFFLMFLGLFLMRNEVSVSGVMLLVGASPFHGFFNAAVALLAILVSLGMVLDRNDVKANWVEQTVNTLAQLCVLLGVICMAYVADYYHAGDLAKEAFLSAQMEEYGAVFYPEGEIKAGLIFYPGAKVEATAYAPLMKEMAEEGMLCVLIQMPDNLAVLDVSAADGVKEHFPRVTDWYMGGHSLGGAMAAKYVGDHSREYSGLVLLAAYSTVDLSDTNLKVYSIYGTNDMVVNRVKLEECRENLPASGLVEYVIEGGNHAGFGDYGAQEGDGEAEITQEEQWQETAQAITK